MKIIEIIKNKTEGLYTNKQPTIAFIGDSVTQGCFEVYVNDDGTVGTVFNSLECYAEKIKKIFSMFFPASNITIVNAGICGCRAETGNERLERDVLRFNPDLTVVCYGLNDSGHKQDGLKKYTDSLRNIFTELRNTGSEIIFMTPNMCTDRVDYAIKESEIEEAAARVAAVVNEGWLDKYIQEAMKVCEEENVPVCDCYGMWKALHKNGVDITTILSNKINHPTKELHWMFAYELVKTMFEK